MNTNFRSIGPQSFLLPCPIFLIGSYIPNEENTMTNLEVNTKVGSDISNPQQDTRKPNIMTAAWGTLCSAQPPALLVAVRSSRLTHASILAHKAFTVNIPDTRMLAEVDYAGIFSAANLNSSNAEDKVSQCYFTAISGDHVDAPYIKECPVVIELKLIEHHTVGTHTLFIGEIMDTKVKDTCFNAEDTSLLPDIKNLDIPCYIPVLREYWSMGEFKAKAFSVGKTMNTKK